MKPVKEERQLLREDGRGEGAGFCFEDNSTVDLPAGVIGRVKGLAGTADQVNANRRLYPASVYRKVIRHFNARRSDQELLGELDHPDPGDGARLEKAALRILTLHLARGRDLEFTAQILDTPHGRTLSALIAAGVAVNVSTRGTGSLRPCCDPAEAAGPHFARVPGAGPGAENAGRSCGSDPISPGAHPAHPCLVVGEDYELHGIDAVVRGAHSAARLFSPARSNEAYVLSCLESGESAPLLDERSVPVKMELLEQPGTRAEDVNGLAELEHDRDRARADLTLMQEAAKAHRENLEAALETLRQERDGLKARLEEAVNELQARLDTATAERNEAREALDRSLLEARVNGILRGVRPELRHRVAEQLRDCETPEQVEDRWEVIGGMLSAAGIDPNPLTGAGRVHEASETGAGEASSLTAEQRLQRFLLGMRSPSPVQVPV